jgi:hypothetical protein
MGLVDLCRTWKAGLSDPAQAAAFGWNQADLTAALVPISAFLTAWDAFEQIDSSRNRAAKNRAKQPVKSALRYFANIGIRYNNLMTEEDKHSYGVRTPISTPTTYPEANLDTSVIRRVILRFQDSGTKKRRRPAGIIGAEIRWALLEREPASAAELGNADFCVTTPFTLTFDEKERGQRLYFCLRWESTTNIKGPYGEICSVVIP